MSQVINRNNYSSQRASYLRFISTALDRFDEKNISVEEKRDITIFILLTLTEIQKTIQQTIQPWEKRGYWVKADQFRAGWKWVDLICNSLKVKINQQKWKSMDSEMDALREMCVDSPPYQRLQVKEPWKGSWQKWQKMQKEAG
ncbi:MAG TPA: hypothetical protein DCK95_07980 [Anaerolineaceae bacterium]|uniref:Uncharacterized protein n=1 Tax=Anaerolinea thermophila TaxID=167964 RepID=A0A101FYJ3_9CHLR|nr:MAG: hypothetical protein XD73_0331 [Anaerolinea thermophila]HAF62249.1 hypothetical protein [Anaerolineaceae bacterium]